MYQMPATSDIAIIAAAADNPITDVSALANTGLACRKRAVTVKATLNKPSKISAQTWMTQFFGLLCLSRGPFGQFAGR
ncbi:MULTISPECIES: hypothetical protein [Acidovorax]|uniref:Uncharacterized protein n=1 Tax=Acidovorax facilis TaxID=12917 RepID=A0ABV8D674_9BURK|nr:hypothetical protein [Acidovorax sp. SD340]KQB56174.1 hypothetical protein AE621_27575 [Acidovorax sp. SD340]MCO4245292.1 hypothetical protein [Acidovorax facilis]